MTPDPIFVDDYRALSDAELIASRGIFIAEGRLVVRRLLTSTRFATRSVLVTPAAHAALADVLPPHVPVHVVAPSLMNEITGFNIHRGCLAAAERPAPADWRDTAARARRLVLLERVANADNVGGIFRNAAAFGADAVLFDDATTDPLYRKAIRTSMGAVLAMPFARAVPWPAALEELRRTGFTLVGLTPDPDATSLDALKERLAGARVAVLLGHEGDGLAPATLSSCDHRVRIPIASTVDSLNVASAAAVALHVLR